MLERPELRLPGPSTILKHSGVENCVTAAVAFLFAVTGPVAILLTVGTNGGLTEAELSSWIFGAFFLNGLLSLVLCLLYRQPLVFLWTIPGIVLVGSSLEHLSFSEIVGAYYVTGALLLILGVTGQVRRCMAAFPMPIVMGMVAGVFLQFGLNWIGALIEDARIAVPMTIGFFCAAAIPAVASRVPPLIVALGVGIASLIYFGAGPSLEQVSLAAATPIIFVPTFSWQALIELVIPLSITVLAVQNGQGIVVLRSAGHKPPINVITIICGLGSAMAAIFGAVSTCLTGAVSGIIVGEKDRKGHFVAGSLVAIFATLFGLFAPFFTTVMLATPKAFISTLAGIALLKVLQTAFTTAFKGPYSLGALLAFTVTLSDIEILNIGAAFWGLVLGFVGSKILERDDFRSVENSQ